MEGETLDEIVIPFIINGKGIKENYRIKNQVYTYDNAATVARLLQLEQPYAWIGKPVESAFVGSPEPELGAQKVLIQAPVIYPKPNLYDPAGGLYIDEDAEVKIKMMPDTEIRYTLDGSVPNRNSPLYSGPFHIEKTTVLSARSFGGKHQESRTSMAYFRLVSSKNGNGVGYRYYESKKDWHFLPVFETLKPISSGEKYEIRIDDINQREGQYGIQFKARLKIETAGDYRFYLNSDDGSKLYINGALIVDNDGGHGTIERSGNVELDAGMHLLKIDYHNQGGGAWLDALYKGPGVPKQIIPADKLFLE